MTENMQADEALRLLPVVFRGALYYDGTLYNSAYYEQNNCERSDFMIKLYSSDQCVWCQRLKSYLDSKNISYRELNVRSEQNAADLYRLSGQNAVPVTVIGNTVIVGFDKTAIDRELEKIQQ